MAGQPTLRIPDEELRNKVIDRIKELTKHWYQKGDTKEMLELVKDQKRLFLQYFEKYFMGLYENHNNSEPPNWEVQLKLKIRNWENQDYTGIIKREKETDIFGNEVKKQTTSNNLTYYEKWENDLQNEYTQHIENIQTLAGKEQKRKIVERVGLQEIYDKAIDGFEGKEKLTWAEKVILSRGKADVGSRKFCLQN
jgi:hypothetical protein